MARTAVSLQFKTRSLFPTVGSASILYIATDENKIYRWDGSNYIEVSSAASESDTLQTVTDRGALVSGGNTSAHIITVPGVQIDTTATPATSAPGLIQWNSVDGTYDMGLLNSSVLQVGQETMFYGKASGAIANGELCQFAGVQGDHILIKKAVGSEIEANPHFLIGVATENISNGDFGYVTWFGKINGVYTKTPANQDDADWTAGDILYFNVTTGQLTKTLPSVPNRVIKVAAVIKEQTGASENGIILIRPTFGQRLQDLDDVNGTPLTTTGQIPVWNQTNGYFDFDYNITDYAKKESSLTNGSVLFANSSGEVAQDNSNFFWDDTNNRLGVGTSSLSSNAIIEARKDQSSYSFITARNDNASGFSGFSLWNGSERARVQYNNASPNLFISTVGSFPIYWGINNSVKASLNSSGYFGVNTINAGAMIQANTASASVIGHIIQGSASQTANLSEWRTSAGTIIDRVDQNGYIHRGDTIEWSETKALPAGAGGFIELGTMLGASISSGSTIEIYIQWYTGGNAQSRKYIVSGAYNVLGASWLRVEPYSEYNGYANSVELDAINSGANTKFRIIAPSTTNRPTSVFVTYKLTNPYLRTTTRGLSTVWTASSTTGTDTSTISPYPYTVVRQRQGELHISNVTSSSGYSKIVAKESQTNELGAGTKGLKLYNTGRVTADGSFGNAGGEFYGMTVNVPNATNDYCEFATISTGSFTAGVEIWTSVRQGGYAVSKRYMVQMDYGATGGAWHKLMPIASSGPYSGNDQDLEISITTGTATIRVRRVSGATTSAIMYVGILVGAMESSVTVTQINNTGTTTAPTVAFAPTAISQINGNVGIGGINGDNPTEKLDVDGNGLFSGTVTAGSDIEITDSSKGVILKSPDATRWRLQVDNSGTLTVTSL